MSQEQVSVLQSLAPVEPIVAVEFIVAPVELVGGGSSVAQLRARSVARRRHERTSGARGERISTRIAHA